MIKWSATRVNTANYCRMKYYLAYVDPDKPKSLRLSAYVRGSFLHKMIEKFWARLGTPEEAAKKSSLKKYYDAESFGDYSRRKWQSIISADDRMRVKYNENVSKGNMEEAEEINEHLIYWKHDQEKWVIKGNMPKLCVPLFSHIIKEGKPLFSELPFDFVINNRRFTGRIDEVRKENGIIIIRDYKSGRPWVGSEKRDFDPQLTMYNVGLCHLCQTDSEVKAKLGLEQSLIDKFMGNPIFVNPDFKVEFFMIDAFGINPSNPRINTVPPAIVPSERRDEHFFELMKMVEGTEESVNTGNIYPERGRKCDDCDMKAPCRQKLNDVRAGTLVDKKKQQYLSFVAPLFIQKEEKPAPDQKKFRFRYPKE